MEANVRPVKLTVSPLEDDHPYFQFLHYVLTWMGGSDYIVTDYTESRVFAENGLSERWSLVKDEGSQEDYVMPFADAVSLAQSLFPRLEVHGVSVSEFVSIEGFYRPQGVPQ